MREGFQNEISILIYDALGLAYYVWKKNSEIKSTKDFIIKGKIKGKIGSFSFDQGEIIQSLDMYKIENKKFLIIFQKLNKIFMPLSLFNNLNFRSLYQ